MRTINRRSIAVTHGDKDYEIEYHGEPVEWIDPVVSEVDGKLHVSYLLLDQDSGHMNPWEEDCSGLEEYRIFDSGHQRNEWVDDQAEYPDPAIVKAQADGRFFWLERYEHGNVRYAINSESSSVDRQWDVAPGVGYIVLDNEWGVAEHTLAQHARNMCENYTNWCNGDVYGIVRAVVDLETGETLDEDSCWGYIGSDYAEATMKEEHA